MYNDYRLVIEGKFPLKPRIVAQELWLASQKTWFVDAVCSPLKLTCTLTQARIQGAELLDFFLEAFPDCVLTLIESNEERKLTWVKSIHQPLKITTEHFTS